jgi:hypothetical protein
VIDESHYWKQPLLKAATWLQRLRIKPQSQQALVRLEREIFVGFYAIRKLTDTMKLTHKIKAMTFPLLVHPCVKRVDYMNCHKIDEFYDLQSTTTELRDLAYLCNQFIHSYVYRAVISEDQRVDGFYVSSDRSRQKHLYFVTRASVLTAFRSVGRDDPTHFVLSRNHATGQWADVVK